MSFQLTLAQRKANRMLGGNEIHCKLVGGSRSGKTFLICRAIAVRALRYNQSNHLISKLRYNSLKATVMNGTWPKMMRLCFPHVPYEVNRVDSIICMPNNSQVHFMGLDQKDRVEKVLGSEFSTLYFNECSQIAYESVLLVLSRLAEKIEGLKLKAYYDLNPGAVTHWTNKLFGLLKDPVTGLAVDPLDYCRMFMNPEDNRENLPEVYFKILRSMPERQRLRFEKGIYVSDLPGALWSIETIDKCRVENHPPLDRIVVAIDPSGTRGEGDNNSIGIVAAGKGVDGNIYVLEDATCNLPPHGWAKVAINLFVKWNADTIVAETNYGGAMVKATIESVSSRIPVKEVVASRGKHIRAEPVSALYEKEAIFHVGKFPELEDQMVSMTTSGFQGTGSPDRLDALVWAVTELDPAFPALELPDIGSIADREIAVGYSQDRRFW